MIKLLDGIRVVECATLVQGDHTGRLLGDLGADVIKVESPGVGDYLRDVGGVITPRNSPWHLFHNRNKRSVSLNLRSDEGREVFFELLATADIFVDGYAGDACDRLGIGYADQCKVKPDIIYCQSTGFGARGPYAQIPTHGYLMMALGGALHVAMADDGFVREVPDPGVVFQGSVSSPILGALYAANTAMAALSYRDRTGHGVYIDSSGADATLAVGGADAVLNWNRDRITTSSTPRIGHPKSPKYDYYETKDRKFLIFAAIESKFWKNFCAAVGRPDWSEVHNESWGVDFTDDGMPNLARALQEIFHTRTLDEWIEIARTHDIAMGPVRHYGDLLKDEHLQSREIFFHEHHPDAGDFTTVGWPAPVSGQPFDIVCSAPSVGQHTDEVLTSLGKSSDEIAALRGNKLI